MPTRFAGVVGWEDHRPSEVVLLNSIPMAAVQIKALKQERHALLVSPDVHGQTPPSQ